MSTISHRSSAISPSAPEKRSLRQLGLRLLRQLGADFTILEFLTGEVLWNGASPFAPAEWLFEIARQCNSLETPRIIRLSPSLACLALPFVSTGFPQAVAVGLFRTTTDCEESELDAVASRIGVSRTVLREWYEQQPILTLDSLDRLGKLSLECLASDYRISQLEFQTEQLGQRIGERLEDLELLYQIVNSVRAAESPERLANLILEWAIRYVPTEVAVVQLFEPGSDEATRNSKFFQAGRPILDANLFDQVLLRLRPDVTGGPIIHAHDPATGANWSFPEIRQIIVAPIHSDRRLAGWIAIANHAHQGWLGTHHARLLSAAAGIMGMRAILFEMQQLREASDTANYLKSRILANVSHELRTPLNGILSFSKAMLSAEQYAPGESKEAFEIIARCGNRLADVVDDLLEMRELDSQHFAVKHVELNIEEIVRTVVSKLKGRAAEKHISIDFEGCDPPLETIHSDPQRLTQLLCLLVGNAIKFTEVGGVRVIVTLSSNPIRALRIEVHDSGIGIPAEKIETIFDPFTQVDLSSTRPHDGLGLGLAISRRIARSLGGHLTASSEPGKGSVFTFELNHVDAAVNPIPAETNGDDLTPGI